jgi:uncharacterized cupredoxin-like copper-binding protein
MRGASLIFVALAAAACARERAPAQAGAAAPQDVTIIATDYGFQLPAVAVKAGLTRMTLDNQGKELHHIQLIRLTDGKTPADFAQLPPEGPPPAWAVPSGGPNAALPGATSSATLFLEPGTYLVACFIPSADGVPHIAKGMVMAMEVLPAEGSPTATVAAGDIAMSLFDYGFSMSPAPSAGTHTFTVTNQAAQPHEVVLVRLEPGATMAPWADWVKAGAKGPPPGTPFAGLTAMAPGMVEDFTADLPPGTYGLICFVPDATDGQPHLFHGMSTTFTVS